MSSRGTYTRDMAATAQQPSAGRGRYRFRTWLRGHAPGPLWRLFPKGRADCGAHEWYRSAEALDRCYHCEVGERPAARLPGVGSATQVVALRAAADAGVEAAQAALDRVERD